MIVTTKDEMFANFKEELLKIVEKIDDEWTSKSSYGCTNYFIFKIDKKKYCVSLCVHNNGGISLVLTKETLKMISYIYEGRNVEDCLEAVRKVINKKKEKENKDGRIN